MEANTGLISTILDALKNGHYGWELLPDMSAHGASIDHLIQVLHVFMIALFAGWAIYLVYCLVRFRARPGHSAEASTKHFKLPTYLEVGVVIFEVFLLVALSTPVWFSYKRGPVNRADAIVVKVTAEQFAWNFHYPGRDGKFGPTKTELIDGTNPVGLDREDPTGKDDIVSVNNFHIPVHRPVILEVTSKDVIHGFGVPLLRLKQDAVPGMVSTIWFEATETGEAQVACAQLCGNGHYRMRGQVMVESAEDFQKFLDEEYKSLGIDVSHSSAAERNS